MNRTLLILGPPGTGKTRNCVDILEHLLDPESTSDPGGICDRPEISVLLQRVARPVSPHRAGFLAYTRAAKAEVSSRVAERSGFHIEWLRTIHSAAQRALGSKCAPLMEAKDWRRFCAEEGYSLSEEFDGEDHRGFGIPRKTEDDELRAAYEWGRAHRVAPERIHHACPMDIRDPGHLARFIRRLEDFKQRSNLFDFTDLLEQALVRRAHLDVDVLFVDEAQDLSPLQVSLVEMWAAACEILVVAGDDDQCIYEYSGATPKWLIALAERPDVTVTILEQSHRVPRKVHAMAVDLIEQNRVRAPKRYEPREEPGSVVQVPVEDVIEELANREGSKAILVRNRIFLGRYAKALREAGVPYECERSTDSNPLGPSPSLEAIRTACALRRRESVSAERMRDLLKFVPAGDAAVLPQGIKAHVSRMSGEVPYAGWVRVFAPGHFLRTVDGDPLGAIPKAFEDPLDREYIGALLRRYGDIPEPEVVVTTIHGSKGRGFDVVALVTDMTKRSWEAAKDESTSEGVEAERRVWYVGLTRTQHTLLLVLPTGRYHYEGWS